MLWHFMQIAWNVKAYCLQKKKKKQKKKYFKMSSAEIFTQIRRPGLQWDVNSLITIFVENCFP